MRVRHALLVATGLSALCSATTASAVDLVVDDAMYYPYSISGYVDLHFGPYVGEEDGNYPGGSWEDSWQGGVFGGAGRAAVVLSPEFTVQGDAWFTGWFGEGSWSNTDSDGDDYSFDEMQGGIAGHASWRPDASMLLGGFASLGMYADWGTFGTAGIEGAIGDEMWRAYGQAGLTAALGGDAGDVNAMDLYARGVLAYYLDPNLSVSANLGVDAFSSDEDGGTTGTGVTWGARLEYKPDSMPFTGYIAYQGWARTGEDNDPEDWTVAEHALVVGMRIPFGADGETTLRAMDDKVGLFDMNPLYGEEFVR